MNMPDVSPGAGEPQSVASGAASKAVKRLRPGPRRITGVVTSDKMRKTRAVQVERSERHAKYGKFIRRHTTYMAHDENEVSKAGDTVLIVEARPLSKTKRWRLVKVLVKSRFPSLAILGPELAGELEPARAGAAPAGAGNREQASTPGPSTQETP